MTPALGPLWAAPESGPADGVPIVALVLVALVCVALAALLSAGEEAGRAVTRAGAADAQARGARGAATVVALADAPARPVRVTAYVRLVLEMAAAVCITLVTVGLLDDWWQVLLAALLACALVNLLVVGASPRSLGRRNPVTVLGIVGPLMLALDRLGAPFFRWAEAMSARAGRTTREEREAHAEHLRDMVDRVAESEEIADDEREMLHSVFELGSTLVREVMVPRTDMVTAGPQVSLRKALTLFVRSGFSRVPVAGDSVDDVVGVLYLKDLLRSVQDHPGRFADSIERIMRPPVFVPETKPVDDLLAQMRGSGVHIAIAFDEYGGVAGLVTMEDIVEELVGDLTDEHDVSEPEVVPDGPGAWIVPARLPLDELGDLFGLEIDDDDVETTLGLLGKALDRVPIPGAAAASHGVLMQAGEASGRRRSIATVRVSRAPEPTTEEDE